jgi:hypothetical protein
MKTHRNTWLVRHGMYGSSFYRRWQAIKTRCDNKKHQSYHRYGGRGVTHSWPDFVSFQGDMYDSYMQHVNLFGEKNTQLDRINNDGNYTKKNCRWVTPKENTNNSSSAKLLTYQGQTLCIRDWGKKLGLSKNGLHERIKKGWPIELALATKPFSLKKRPR